MATDEAPPVDMKHLTTARTYLRDLRAWSAKRNISPWVIRQAVITFMTIDTHVALERGIEVKTLRKFDAVAKQKAREFIETMPEEARARGR